MATTTNYSWSTPDDTALVKDGASAIRTLGSSADTTVKALNPGTTAGDIDYYTTSTAKARVGIGTANQVLRVNSGATAPEWATLSSGGMTLLSTTTLSGVSTTISTIDQTYVNLFVLVTGVTGNTANSQIRVRPNNSTSNHYCKLAGSSAVIDISGEALGLTSDTSLRTNADNAWAITFYNYASSSTYKPFVYSGTFLNLASVRQPIAGFGTASSNTAISSLVIDYGGTNTLAGGTVLIYGVK
jgi:hypothetical protein